MYEFSRWKLISRSGKGIRYEWLTIPSPPDATFSRIFLRRKVGEGKNLQRYTVL